MSGEGKSDEYFIIPLEVVYVSDEYSTIHYKNPWKSFFQFRSFLIIRRKK